MDDDHGDRRSLLTVTAAWVLLGLLPLLLLTSSSINLADDAVRAEVDGGIRTTASVGRVVVEQQMGSLKQLVNAFADRAEMRTMVTSPHPPSQSGLARMLDTLARMRSGVRGVILINSDGYMIGSEPRSGLPQDVNNTDWYQAVRTQNQAYVSQAFTPTMGTISRAVAVAAPIPRAEGGGLLGILAVIYSLDAIQDFTSEAAEAQGIRLLITDQTGVLVADPGRKLYALTSLREDPRVDAALAGRTWLGSTRSPDGIVLSASEPIPSIGWTVTAERPAATALASADQLRTQVLLVAALLAVLIIAGMAAQLQATRGRRKAQRTLAGYAKALAAARDEALRASVAKTEFLAKVSHEIRTPINGVLGMNALLLETRMDGEQRHYASTVQASAQNLLRLLDDFLDLSKIEAGHLDVEAVPFDLPRLCDEVVAPFAAQAYRQGLWLTLHPDDNLPQQVIGDPVRLRQVLTNVLSNALKFTPQGGVDLEVTLDEPPDTAGAAAGDRVTLRFTVTDTGVGVGPEDHARVFEIFRQVDSPITRRTGGSGLGLAISRQLTELMGGQMGLDSVEGVGSRFWITLPVTVVAWSDPAPAVLRGRRVLVADARQEDRALAGQLLAGAGLVVEETADPDTALRLLRAAAANGHPFDLAVVDLDLGVATEPASDPEATAGPAGGEPPTASISLAAAILADLRLRATNVIVLVTPGRTGFAWPEAGVADDRTVQSITRPVSRRLLAAAANAQQAAMAHDQPPDVDTTSVDVEHLPAHAGIRILVAEDDAVSGQVAKLVLEKAGHHVDIVDDGRQAVTAVLTGDYDVVLMDCQLPVLDGLAATEEIRQRQDRSQRVPIIAMTAAAMPDDRARCLQAGMDDHLTKPVNWQYLLGRLPCWTNVSSDDQGDLGDPVNANGEIPVELEGLSAEEIGHIAQAFLASAPDTLDRLRRAAREADTSEVAALAHRFKGSCATVGATRLVALCERIEEAARSGASASAMLTIVAEVADALELQAHEMSWLAHGADRTGDAVVMGVEPVR